jgi:hypothetical protein
MAAALPESARAVAAVREALEDFRELARVQAGDVA